MHDCACFASGRTQGVELVTSMLLLLLVAAMQLQRRGKRALVALLQCAIHHLTLACQQRGRRGCRTSLRGSAQCDALECRALQLH